MATRPFAFGARFKENGRTVRVGASRRDPKRYTVEVSRDGRRTRKQEHTSLTDAMRDFAASWRARLH